MTTPTPSNALVNVLAEWEDKNGTMAAIMPDEWAGLMRPVMNACMIQSPRQIRRELAAAQEELASVKAERDALRKDAERLDWAESHPVEAHAQIVAQWTLCGIGGREQFFNFRRAIDAAIAEGK